MAYITASETKSIRNALKDEFGKTLKFSVRNSHHSSVNINLLESSVYNLESNPDYDCNEGNGFGFGQVSPWMTPKDQVENLLKKIDLIAKNAPAKDGGKEWYDNSDMMTDYFNTAYYVFTDIGKWNKPFKFTGTK
jgi:hypothetical protein